MKKLNIFGILLTLLLVAGCDYNDKYFSGYNTGLLTDEPQYEGIYTGDYPEEGYFRDRSVLTNAIDSMLKAKFLYADNGSTAKISVLFGDVTSGFSTADVNYTLAAEDYVSMGIETGQPGKYKNFDGNMDIDSYLIPFCTAKYTALPDGSVVNISYEFYTTGAGVSVQSSSYKKVSGYWLPAELNAFTADITYTLDVNDYDAMGTGYGEPGRYNNFDGNMDINMYISAFLKLKYPYTTTGKTAEVLYLFYANSVTESRSSYYKYDGVDWSVFNPYQESVDIATKVAEMEFDGTDWTLARLLGGSQKISIGSVEMGYLVDWVTANKSSYLQDNQNEFYYGASTQHGNISNSYNSWKANDPRGEYKNLSNDALQELMDERLAEGLATHVLPEIISNPDPGLSYNIVCPVYGGRGTGNYIMSFLYNEEDAVYELVGGPVKE